jgi:hypothetical protein
VQGLLQIWVCTLSLSACWLVEARLCACDMLQSSAHVSAGTLRMLTSLFREGAWMAGIQMQIFTSI